MNEKEERFEEQFPPLRLRTYDIELELNCDTKEILGQRKWLKGDGSGKWIKKEDAIEYCLAKQRVKEWLLINYSGDLEKAYKELGM